MNRGNSKKEQKIIREADKIISMKENVDALSWSRVQEIADELRRSTVSDERRDELARELISISQANISLSAKLGILSDSQAPLEQQPSTIGQAATDYVAPKWKSENAPHPEDSEFFHAQEPHETAQNADVPAGEDSLIIPRADVSSTDAAPADMPAKTGPTIEEVLADSSAATTHPIAPVPDENPVTSDPLINNAAADQIASGIDKMVDDLEDRYKQRQQDEQPQDEGNQNNEGSETKPAPLTSEAPATDAQLKETQEATAARSEEKRKEEKKKDNKKKRKEEKKARKAQKAARKAQQEAEAKAKAEAQQQAAAPEKNTEQDEVGNNDEHAPQPQESAAAVEATERGGSGSVSLDGAPDPAATEDPDVIKVSGFATFKNVYSSRDARMSLYQDDDGHLVAVDNSKLV